MRILIAVLVFLISGSSIAQINMGMPINKDTLRTVKGDSLRRETDERALRIVRILVLERETRQAIPDAHVILSNEAGNYLRITDQSGSVAFPFVPIGRHTITVTHVAFKSAFHSLLVAKTGDVFVEMAMESNVGYLRELRVMDKISFTPETVLDPNEISHHAGRPEQIRKITTLTGTQEIDDSRNDVVIRGNSAQSNNWRIAGVNIPNPNHFNIPGTTGGPVSFVTDKALGISTFHSAPFSARFGNSTSAVFDLQLRNGDTTSHLGNAQLGLYGAEVGAEGPISAGASYLVNFRHSILGFLQSLPVDIGTKSVPNYWDSFLKLNFPLKRNANFWLFGMSAKSRIDIEIDTVNPGNNIYGEKDRNQYLRCQTHIYGGGFNSPVVTSGKAYLTTTLALSEESTSSNHYLMYFPEDLKRLTELGDSTRVFHYDFRNRKVSMFTNVAVKVRNRNLINVGFSYDLSLFNHVDSIRNITTASEDYGLWRRRLIGQERASLIQPFAEWKSMIEELEITVGLHGQFYTLSKSRSLEPRLTMYYYPTGSSRLKLAYGHHSQTHQPYVYLYGPSVDDAGNPVLVNKDIDFTRSRNLLIGYERNVNSLWVFRLEYYYQSLYNVPVDRDRASSYSLLNTGSDFTRPYPQPLINNGTGRNTGAELTLDREFDHGFLFRVTGTVFDSKYRGSDDVLRNTDFNSRYIANVLATKEWQRKRHILSLAARLTTKGGRWYGPIDEQASQLMREVIYVDQYRNNQQFKSYWRFDFRIVYKKSANNIHHELSLDFINLFGIRNVLRHSYFPIASAPGEPNYEIRTEEQLGFLPFFYYRMDFRFRKR